eukprot:6254511-Ditylum_brightwellii.AAC.1
MKILVDNFSRLKRLITLTQLTKGKHLVKPGCFNDEEDSVDTFFFKQTCSGVYDKDFQASFKCYLNLPDNGNPEQNPLSFHHIREQQQANSKLLAVKQKFPQNYIYKFVDDNVEDFICYIKDFHDVMTQ